MSSDDWYRNTHWNAEVEAAFDARLARSRAQKAQYLRIQGSLLKDSHPEVAVRLLKRCIDEGDSTQIAAALLDTAHAHYVLENLERALQALEAAMEQQVREPMFRTSAAYDYAMLVVLHDRTERYDRALAAIDAAEDRFFASMIFQAEAARAIIYASRGQQDRAMSAARRALSAREEDTGWIPGHPEVGIVPRGDDPLTPRVRAIIETENR